MTEDECWEKVRQIVREENERLEARILAAVKGRSKISLENGRWVGVTDAQIDAWKEAYPTVDIQAELKKMSAWVLSNPHVAPKSQWARFANTWLARAHDRAAVRSIPLGEVKIAPKKACAYCSDDATGSTSGILHCNKHIYDAMDGKPRRMLGVVPAPVAGRD